MVGRGIDRRDLALAEGVIKRLIDQRGRYAEPVGGVAVDIDSHGRGRVLLVRGDVLQLRQFAHLGFEDRRPVIEFSVVGVGQRVLVLCAAEAAADRDVLRHLHEEFCALDPGHFLAQALDDLISGIAALLERLQGEKDAGGVLGGVIGIGPGEHEDAANARILRG